MGTTLAPETEQERAELERAERDRQRRDRATRHAARNRRASLEQTTATLWASAQEQAREDAMQAGANDGAAGSGDNAASGAAASGAAGAGAAGAAGTAANTGTAPSPFVGNPTGVFPTPHPFVTRPYLQLPMLNTDRVEAWVYQVKAFMLSSDLAEALQDNAPPVPLHGNFLAATPLEQKVTTAKLAILGSIPDDTHIKIGDNVADLNPAQLLAKIVAAHQKQSTPEYREQLREKAARLTIKYGESMDEYITRHEELRIEMRRAHVPEIADESTTVRFIINGLVSRPAYAQEIFSLRLRQIDTLDECKTILNMLEIAKSSKRTATNTRSSPKRQGKSLQESSAEEGNLYCDIHGWTFHTTEQCRVKKRQTASGKTAQKGKPRTKSTTGKGARGTHNKGKANRAQASTDDDSSSPDSHADDGVNTVDSYLLDSGCYPTHTRTKPPGSSSKVTRVELPDGTHRATQRYRDLTLQLQNGKRFRLSTVNHAPDFTQNLLSVSALTKENNCHVVLTPQGGFVTDPLNYDEDSIQGHITLRDDLFYFDGAQLKMHTAQPQRQFDKPRIAPVKRTQTRHHVSKRSTRPTAQGARVLHTPVTGPGPRPVTDTPVRNLGPPDTATATGTTRTTENFIVPHHAGHDGRTQKRSSLPRLATPRARGGKDQRITTTIPYPTHLPDIPAKDRARYDEAHNWHVILNHVNVTDLQTMAKDTQLGLPTILKGKFPPMHCSGCSHGKLQRAPHKGVTKRTPPGHTLVTDMAQIEEASDDGFLHFMTITEMYTRFKWVFLLKRKSEAERYLIETVTKIQRHFNQQVAEIRCDNANEYLTRKQLRIFSLQGTTIVPTIAHTPQQNSVSERTNRTIMGKVRATLDTMKLTFATFWPYCVLDTVIKGNSCYQSTIQDVPRRLFESCRHEYSPYPPRGLNLQQYRHFGELGYIPELSDKKRKRDPRGILVRYLFCAHPGRYKVRVLRTGQLLLCRIQDFRPYNPNFDPKRLVHSKLVPPQEGKAHKRVNQHHAHVTQAYHANEDLATAGELSDNSSDKKHHTTDDSDSGDKDVDDEQHTETPVANPNAVHYGDNVEMPVALQIENIPAAIPDDDSIDAMMVTAPSQPVTDTPRFLSTATKETAMLATQLPAPPKTLAQARNAADSEAWEAAYDSEMQSHRDFGTFKLRPKSTLPKGTFAPRAVNTFTYKTAPTGAVLGRKVRISFPGNQLAQAKHYDPRILATYTADRDAIRLVLAFAVHLGLQLRHLDLKTAFLHERYVGLLPLFMQYPVDFDGTQPYPQYIAQIMQNIYGTKHAPKIYIEGMYNHLARYKYQQLRSDINVFMFREGHHILLMAITIDDFLVAYSDPKLYTDLLRQLRVKYTVKELGFPQKLLNWKIARDDLGTGLYISQPELTRSLISAMRMTDANPSPTPYLSGVKLHPAEPDETLLPENYPYSSALGILRYLVDCTRPDLAYCAGALARVLSRPTMRHWNALKQVVRYLIATPNYGLHYTTSTMAKPNLLNKLDLTAQSDSDLAGCKTTCKSTYGNVIFLGNNPISWRSQKIGTVVMTTCAAEYIALSNTAQHLQWLRELLSEITGKPPPPSLLQGDNSSSQTTANSAGPTKRSKYISIRYHYIRDQIRRGEIKLQHVPSAKLIADIFTKPLPRTQFSYLAKQIVHDCQLPRLQGAVEDQNT